LTRVRRAARVLAIVALACAPSVAAHAGTSTASLKPTMTIANACLDTSATVSFPNYLPNSPSVVAAAGSGATITCNDSDAWSIKAGAGNNATHATGTCGASTCKRAMADGAGHFISYDLFVGTCCSGTIVWNATNAIAGTATGTAQPIAFWGEVAAAQNVAAATYTDTVVATYTF
jgi:spore coat protein U-like protein